MKPLIRPLGARGVRLFKVYVMKVVLLSTLLLASLSARAELIEAQGSAAILGGDEIYAREQATRDALRQALLASGASVSSIQRLDIGLGFESGLSVVLLAIILDRLTESFGARQQES